MALIEKNTITAVEAETKNSTGAQEESQPSPETEMALREASRVGAKYGYQTALEEVFKVHESLDPGAFNRWLKAMVQQGKEQK